MNDFDALTPKQQKFVEVYVATRNAFHAYCESYDARRMSPASAYMEGHRLLRHPKVAPVLESRLAQIGQEMAENTEFTVVRALTDFLELANADPDELTGMRVGACRHCWGEDHGYQWKEREYVEALEKAEKNGEELPDIGGGFGYRRTNLPNPLCPECEGEGIQRNVPVDTSKLSPGARMLFAGVKPTRNGMEIKIADREKARENAAKIIGAFKERLELTGGVATIPTDLKDPQEAAKAYAEFIKASKG